MRYRVIPYKKGSRSSKALSRALGGKVLNLTGSRFKPKPEDVVINWGRTKDDFLLGWPLNTTILNRPEYIYPVSNKKLFFSLMKERAPEVIPEFWTSKEDIPDDVYPIVCRTVLNGHSGAGIVIASTPGELVEAPLYVRYVKKKDEYRVHLGFTEYDVFEPEPTKVITTISVQRKARRTSHENPNWQIRNYRNGFVYVRGDVNPPEAVLDAARKAFEATNLDFGAVDVIWNEHEGKAYVLEINTAPGLEGQTVNDYKNFFNSLN